MREKRIIVWASPNGSKAAVFTDDFEGGIDAWQAVGWEAASDNGSALLKGETIGDLLATRSSGSHSDYVLTAKVKIISGTDVMASAGLVLRSDTTDNDEYYFGLFPNASEPGWRLYEGISDPYPLWMPRLPAGSGTQAYPVNLNQYYTLKAVIEGGTITLFIDGVEVGSYTDQSPVVGANVSLRAYHATAYFDDVCLEPIAFDPATAITLRYNDVTGALMHELNATDDVIATYTSTGSNHMISVTRNSGGGSSTYFYHYNSHGDVVAMTDESGEIVAKFSYDSWGNPTEYNASGQIVELGTWAGTPGNGLFFLFGGMIYDAAAGLYLTRTRAYNPRNGRFLQRDVLDESGKNGVFKGFPFGRDAIGTNLYAWCANNPVTKVDPSGLDGVSAQEVLAVAGAILGAIIGGILGGPEGAAIGAAVGAAVGGAVGAAVDHSLGYAGVDPGPWYDGGDAYAAGAAKREAEEAAARQREADRIEAVKQKYNNEMENRANAELSRSNDSNYGFPSPSYEPGRSIWKAAFGEGLEMAIFAHDAKEISASRRNGTLGQNISDKYNGNAGNISNDGDLLSSAFFVVPGQLRLEDWGPCSMCHAIVTLHMLELGKPIGPIADIFGL